jgi:hypothetical protein
VASDQRERKVLEEINRPVSPCSSVARCETCTFLSYDHVREIAALKHLARLSDGVLDN